MSHLEKYKYLLFKKDQLFSVVQKCFMEFSDDLNSSVKSSGTGFWLITKKGNVVFVTNKHNVEPAMKNPLKFKQHQLKKLNINVKAFNVKSNHPDGAIMNLEIDLEQNGGSWKILKHQDENVDVVLVKPTSGKSRIFIPNDENLQLIAVPEELCNLSRKIEVLDELYFVGFPLIKAKAKYQLPIFRKCSVASYPDIDYSEENPNITKYTCLVDGLSFGGSSGSLVMRIDSNSNKKQHNIVGIMSGHWEDVENTEWDDTKKQWTMDHKGLSYLTIQQPLLEIIKKHGL